MAALLQADSLAKSLMVLRRGAKIAADVCMGSSHAVARLSVQEGFSPDLLAIGAHSSPSADVNGCLEADVEAGGNVAGVAGQQQHAARKVG